MAINLLKQLAKDTISTKGQKAARKISLNYSETKSTLRDGDIGRQEYSSRTGQTLVRFVILSITSEEKISEYSRPNQSRVIILRWLWESAAESCSIFTNKELETKNLHPAPHS